MTSSKINSIVLVICLHILNAGSASGQSVTETIARSGVETSAGTINSFSNAALGDDGTVASWATWNPNGIQLFSTGIFKWNEQGVTRIAGEGEDLPTGDGTFDLFFANLKVNSSGSVLYQALVQANGSGESGFYLHSENNLQQIVRTDQTIPGTSDTFTDFLSPSLNNANQVAFYGFRSTGNEHYGNFLSTSGNLERVLLDGDTLPGNATAQFSSIPKLNNVGTVGFTATNSDLNGDVLYYSQNGNLTEQLREGTDLFGFIGQVNNIQLHSLNDTNQSLLELGLSGGTSTGGLFVHSTDQPLKTIALVGNSAPSGNGNLQFFSNQRINQNGQVGFHAFLSDTLGGASDNLALFRSENGSLREVVRRGDDAYDTSGTFVNFASDFNDQGVWAWRSTLADTDNGSLDDSGIFISDGFDQIKIVQEGDSLSGSTITSLSVSSDFLNAKGQVLYVARLADGSEQLRRWTPDLQWRTDSSGNWADTINWTLGLETSSIHQVRIDSANDINVIVDSRAESKNLFISALNATGRATVELRDGATLSTVNGLNIFENGTLTGVGSVEGLIFNRGRIVADNLSVVDAGQGSGIVNFAGTLEGHGIINADITNNSGGVIRSTGGNVLQLTGGSLSNRGLVEVRNGELQVSANLMNLNDLSGTGLVAARDAILRFQGGVQNQGAIAFTDGFNDVFGDIVNTGNISVGGDAEVVFYDDIVQNGDFVVSSFGSRTSSAIVLGEFSGAGGFSGGGDLFLLGDLRPGNSPDSVLFDGNLFLGASAWTEVEFAGSQFGEFDQLVVTGDLNLNGALTVGLLDGFLFGANQEFVIADVGGNLIGKFNGLNEGDLVAQFGGRDLFISYTAGDGNDVALFTAVPEPGSTLFLILGTFLGLRHRRRN